MPRGAPAGAVEAGADGVNATIGGDAALDRTAGAVAGPGGGRLGGPVDAGPAGTEGVWASGAGGAWLGAPVAAGAWGVGGIRVTGSTFGTEVPGAGCGAGDAGAAGSDARGASTASLRPHHRPAAPARASSTATATAATTIRRHGRSARAPSGVGRPSLSRRDHRPRRSGG